MKIYKKIAILVIIFILSTVLSVYADNTGEGAEITLTPSSTTIKAGETVTVTISAECETGVEGLDAILTWDKTKLEFINSEEIDTDDYSSMSGINELTQEFKVSMLCIATPTPTESDVAVLEFEVLDTVEEGEEISIELSDITVADSNYEEITIENQELKLDVAVDEPEPEPELEPTVEDETPADKTINNAGLERNSFLLILAIALVTFILYNKCKQFKDVK